MGLFYLDPSPNLNKAAEGGSQFILQQRPSAKPSAKFKSNAIKKPQMLIGTAFEVLLLVVWAGIEPATQGFSVLCSTDWATAPSFFYLPSRYRSTHRDLEIYGSFLSLISTNWATAPSFFYLPSGYLPISPGLPFGAAKIGVSVINAKSSLKIIGFPLFPQFSISLRIQPFAISYMPYSFKNLIRINFSCSQVKLPSLSSCWAICNDEVSQLLKYSSISSWSYSSTISPIA